MRTRLFLLAILWALLAGCDAGHTTPYPSSDIVYRPDTYPITPPPDTSQPGGSSPPSTVRFDDSAFPLGRPGAFPSDLVVDSAGVLYTVDDAAIPATVLGIAASGSPTPVLSVPITSASLIDADGTTPARAPGAYGPGLFGAYTGDLELVFDRWLLVTVGAGNSVSTDGSAPLRLANLVVIDVLAGKVVQTVNLAWGLPASGTTSDGRLYPSIPQSLPVMCSFVPGDDGEETGKVYVAMSNAAGTNAGLTMFFAGTVQVWEADFTRSQPLAPDLTAKPTAHTTRTWVSERYNPVALTRFAADTGVDYLLLTAAGASRFDAAFVAHPTTDAYLEVFDTKAEQWRDAWAVNLGKILPAPHALALGRDAHGVQFGLVTSQTFGAVYLLDLSGLDSDPVATLRLGLARVIDLVPDGAGTAGSGYQPAIVIAPSGSAAIVSSFTTSGLHVIGIPDDVRRGRLEVGPPPFDVADLLAEEASGLGALVVARGLPAEAYVVVNGAFDANYAPARQAYVGALYAASLRP